MATTTVKRFSLETHKIEDVVIEVCCEEMGQALQDGTDNEGWGALVRHFSFSEGLMFGGGTPVARYCPWCGKKLV